MSKVLIASCEAGKVTVEGQEIDAQIFSEGVAKSDGILIIDKGQKYYFAKTSPDTITVIESVVEIMDQLATILTGLDGATNSPGAQSANITQLNVLKTEFDAIKDDLK